MRAFLPTLATSSSSQSKNISKQVQKNNPQLLEDYIFQWVNSRKGLCRICIHQGLKMVLRKSQTFQTIRNKLDNLPVKAGHRTGETFLSVVQEVWEDLRSKVEHWRLRMVGNLCTNKILLWNKACREHSFLDKEFKMGTPLVTAKVGVKF